VTVISASQSVKSGTLVYCLAALDCNMRIRYGKLKKSKVSYITDSTNN